PATQLFTPSLLDALPIFNGLVRWTIGRGLAGLEAWAGTPGTVGGAIRGNAHWGGQDIATRVRSVTLAARDGSIVDVPRDEMGFRSEEHTSELSHVKSSYA